MDNAAPPGNLGGMNGAGGSRTNEKNAKSNPAPLKAKGAAPGGHGDAVPLQEKGGETAGPSLRSG